MYYYLKTDNEVFTRPEWQALDENLRKDWSNIEELYLGDILFRVKDPTSYIQEVFQKIPENSVLYIEGYNFYSICNEVVYGSKNLKDLSDIIIKYKYNNLLDIDDCGKLLKNAGFELTYEDIDGSKFCITFFKPSKD